MKELILRRYNNANYILNMESEEFFDFLKLAKYKELEEKIRLQWVVQIPFMGDNFISFNDYMDKVTGKNIDMRSTEDILKDIEETHRKLKGGK